MIDRLSLAGISLLGAILLVPQLTNAQPTVEWTPLPELGYSAQIKVAGYIAPSAPSGDAQSWDFSDVEGTVFSNFEVAPASASPFAPLFSGAYWTAQNGDQLSFFALVNGGFTIMGNANTAASITIPFTDPLTQWTFPLEYGDVSSDDFSAEVMLFGLPYTLVGDVTAENDAWGSLTMPDGTVHEEVMRVNYSQFYTETYDGDTADWYLNQVVYFAEGQSFPLFLHEELIVTDNAGVELLNGTDVAWYSDLLAAVPLTAIDVADVAFPNPVMSGASLYWTLPPGCHWKVMGLNGKVIDHGVSVTREQKVLDTSSWGRGVVLLVPLTREGQTMGKVQRVFIQ